MCAFGSHAFSWSSLPSNHQDALLGPPDGCGAPNSLSSLGLIGVSPLSTPHLLTAASQKHSFPSFVPPNHCSVHQLMHAWKFDTDSQKFLIDSGASAHLWNHRKDFISYHPFSPQERKNDQVLGVSGEAVAPEGIGSVRLRIEDDLNDIHTIHLHDVWYLPEARINIFVSQVFSQQRQSEGDSKSKCSISAENMSLQWTRESGNMANKYVPLNKSNVGICFTASGYKQFQAFAALCGMPATFISDDKADEPIQAPPDAPITMTPSKTPIDQPQRSVSRELQPTSRRTQISSLQMTRTNLS